MFLLKLLQFLLLPVYNEENDFSRFWFFVLHFKPYLKNSRAIFYKFFVVDKKYWIEHCRIAVMFDIFGNVKSGVFKMIVHDLKVERTLSNICHLWYLYKYTESAKVTRPSVFAGKISVGLVKKSTHRTGCLEKNSIFIYIKALQSGKTWCGLVKCKNLPDRLSCEQYKLSRRLNIHSMWTAIS